MQRGSTAHSFLPHQEEATLQSNIEQPSLAILTHTEHHHAHRRQVCTRQKPLLCMHDTFTLTCAADGWAERITEACRCPPPLFTTPWVRSRERPGEVMRAGARHQGAHPATSPPVRRAGTHFPPPCALHTHPAGQATSQQTHPDQAHWASSSIPQMGSEYAH